MAPDLWLAFFDNFKWGDTVLLSGSQAGMCSLTEHFRAFSKSAEPTFPYTHSRRYPDFIRHSCTWSALLMSLMSPDTLGYAHLSSSTKSWKSCCRSPEVALVISTSIYTDPRYSSWFQRANTMIFGRKMANPSSSGREGA